MRGRHFRIRERLTYANVMATIAVFGVLAGGGAWAAANIGADDIKANAVRSRHIKKHQVRKSDLARSAIPFAGSGSIQVASDRTMHGTPETLMKLKGIGRLTDACSNPGSHTSGISLVNTSGKRLAVDLIGSSHPTNDGQPPSDTRYEVASGDDLGVVLGLATEGYQFGDTLITITAANGSKQPQAFGTLSAHHGCDSPGFVTAMMITGQH